MAYPYDYPPPRRQPPPTILSMIGGMLIAVVAGLAVLWALGFIHIGRQAALHNPDAKPREIAPRTERNADELERITVYKETLPSVVNVDTLASTARGILGDDERSLGTGTGFFWDDDGDIVTNFHVVRDALALNNKGEVIIHPERRIMVTLHNGETVPTRIRGIAPDNDLAVLQLSRLPRDGVKKIRVGSSEDLEVGQTVYAIGSPFGQKSTLTTGIISALNRAIQSPSQHIINGVIQTDAAINPGNSGGPLLDKDGRLIGVNTAITSPSGGSVGIGYAIPVNTVNKVVPELIRTGRVAQPYIGAEYVLEEARVRRAGIASGVVVRNVRPGSPAAMAGMQPGDIILQIDDTKIDGLADLEKILNAVKVGDTLNVTVRRRNQSVELTVRVEGI